MTAGIETLKALSQSGVYIQMEAQSARLEEGIAQAASEKNVALHISRSASLLTAFFTSKPVVDYESARQADTTLFGRFFQHLLAEGIYWPPSQFEAAFVSLAHSDEDIQATIGAIKKALSQLTSEG
jgi:glutamate-1-semialdehyde 2,1-aminomutase